MKQNRLLVPLAVITAVVVACAWVLYHYGAVGDVVDKRFVHGQSGNWYQLQIDQPRPLRADTTLRWFTVPQHTWDKCQIRDLYPLCA